MGLIAEIDAPDRAPLAEGLNRRRFRLVSEYHELIRPVWVEETQQYEMVTIYLTSDIPFDWTRLRNGVLNVSIDHDDRVENSVGVVERVEMENKTIIGTMAFNDVEAGKEAWQKVQEGTLAGISPDVFLKLRFGKVSDGQGGMKRVGYPVAGEITDVSLVSSPDDANLYITKMELRGEMIPVGDAPLPEIAGVAFDDAGELLSVKVKMAFGTGDMAGAVSDRSYRGEKDMEPEAMAAKMAAMEEEMAAMKAKMEGDGASNGEEDKEEREEMRAKMSKLSETIEEFTAEMARQKEIRTAALAAGMPELAEEAITEGTTVQEFTMGLLKERYQSVQVAMGRSRPAAKTWFDFGALCDALVKPADTAAQGAASFEMSVMKEHESVVSADRPLPMAAARAPVGSQVLALPSRREWHERFNAREQFQMAEARAKMNFATSDMAGAISNTAMFDFAVPYPMDYASDRLIGMCYYREGLVDNVRYPVTIAGIAPAFVAEGNDGGTAEPQVIEQTLTPHALEREVEITRRSTIQTGGWSMDETFRVAETDFRHRMVQAIIGTSANAAGNTVTVAGAPSATVIGGVLNQANPSGVTDANEIAARGAVTQPSGFSWASTDDVPDYDELLKLITALSQKRAPYESRAYILAPAQVQPYSRTPQFVIDATGTNAARAAAAGPMILEGMAGAERIGRFPAVETTFMPTGVTSAPNLPTIIAGVWAAMNIGTWNTPLFWVDALTKTGQVVFHAYHEFDVSMARSDYFTKAVRTA